jgi:hypothetical protein
MHNIRDDREAFAKFRVYSGNGAEFLSIMRKIGINILLPFNRLCYSENIMIIIGVNEFFNFLNQYLLKTQKRVAPLRNDENGVAKASMQILC